MIKKLFAALGLGWGPGATDSTPPPAHAPYNDRTVDFIYNLLFCDDPSRFDATPGKTRTPQQQVLFADPPALEALQALAHDSAAEGRYRYLACMRLRALGAPVAQRLLLGVIVEVPLEHGLDTLAAFSEGGVRYINQAGKLLVIEQQDGVKAQVDAVFASVEPILDKIGPWLEARLAPPRDGVRFTFLVSDGMYFGQGPMAAMRSDPMSAPLLSAATQLLQAAVELGLNKGSTLR